MEIVSRWALSGEPVSASVFNPSLPSSLMPRAHSASTSSDTLRASGSGSRHVTHVSRACDGCRRRKMRCDGVKPQCGACRDRGSACEYKDEDRRKTHTEQMDDIKSRMDRFEDLIHSLIDSMPSRASVPLTAAMQVDPVSPTPMHTLPIPMPDDQPHQLRPDAAISKTVDTRAPFASTYIDDPAPIAPPETSPITKTSLLAVAGSSSEPERFSRVEDAGGSLLHFGPTSLWTYKAPRRSVMSQSPNDPPRRSGDWVDWSRHLPPSLQIDRATHDKALEYFSAFYAPWLLIVDVPAFRADMLQGDISIGSRPGDSTAVHTAHRSPLLHCCILYLGLFLIREEEPELMRRFDEVFVQHCYPLLLLESDQPSLSSLRALHMFAATAHLYRMATHSRGPESWERPYSTGYLHSGMPIAAVNVMGLNVDCSSYVARGQITDQERDARDYGFWTAFLLDTIRGVAGGRAPMIPAAQIPFPRIHKEMDDEPWVAPGLAPAAGSACPGLIMSGTRSMVSTTFHWAARLGVIAHSLITRSYSSIDGDSNREALAGRISQQLDEWYDNLPLRPAESYALPHILTLHCVYHLCVILVHRPFYRAALPDSEARCDYSAMAILSLERLFDSTYGFRFAHHNHINALFGAATIFLLKVVGAVHNSDTWRREEDNFTHCLELFARLGTVWQEARMAREVLVGLYDEYISTSMASNPDTSSMASLDPSKDLQDWLALQDAWGVFFPDQTINWDQSGFSF